MNISETRYELKDTISYAHAESGDCDAEFVTLHAPSLADISLIAPLRQYYNRALLDLSVSTKGLSEDDGPEDDNKDEITAAKVLFFLESSNVDMVKIINSFKKLALTGKVKLEGEVTFTNHIWDQLSLADCYNIIGEYYANFIIASPSQ